jgi:hypothetical protein
MNKQILSITDPEGYVRRFTIGSIDLFNPETITYCLECCVDFPDAHGYKLLKEINAHRCTHGRKPAPRGPRRKRR